MKSIKPPTKLKTLDSVHNALRILKSFSSEEPVKRVMDLSRTLGLDKSSVSRIIATLKLEGFIENDSSSSGYRLGPSVLSLGNSYKSSHELYHEAKPVLKNLVEITGETAQLAILTNANDVLFIESIECKNPLRFMASPGSRSPIYCSSSGKILIAFQNDDQILNEVISKELVPWTSRTITDERIFREELSKVRRQGYAISYGERYEGVNAVAIPVRNKEGAVVAAINIIGPNSRLKQDKLNLSIRHLIRAANEISKSFQY
jgi:IclR family KDG regulon transcriptional repressor